MQTRSRDGIEIHYEVSGGGDTALVFVHGWMGNVRWWDHQRDAFQDRYRVVTIDLAGHGASGARSVPSVQGYVDDILSVVRAVDAPRVVLVGHSMSGVYTTLAAPDVPRLAALILIDTMKNLETIPTAEQAAPMFAAYRADFAGTVKNWVGKMLFTASTPVDVRARIEGEFLATTGDVGAALLEPLYTVNVREAARRVTVPVRGIGGDTDEAATAVNRRSFADYDYVLLAGCGHYPMLERPRELDAALRAQVEALGHGAW